MLCIEKMVFIHAVQQSNNNLSTFQQHPYTHYLACEQAPRWGKSANNNCGERSEPSVDWGRGRGSPSPSLRSFSRFVFFALSLTREPRPLRHDYYSRFFPIAEPVHSLLITYSQWHYYFRHLKTTVNKKFIRSAFIS